MLVQIFSIILFWELDRARFHLPTVFKYGYIASIDNLPEKLVMGVCFFDARVPFQTMPFAEFTE